MPHQKSAKKNNSAEKGLRILDSLIGLSVEIEHEEDLIGDLRRDLAFI